MSLTLLVLAAGMGSRYGGLKQIDPVAPSGETVLDYAVFDALRAGFDRVVFVIRRDFAENFRTQIGAKYAGHIAVDYVFQSLETLPSGFAPPPAREKPWGTGHAVWCAREAIRENFAVINADDFYGADSFAQLAAFLAAARGAEFAMAGFQLASTLSEHGTVARGVCSGAADGRLHAIVEQTGIAAADVGHGKKFSGNEIVSMNCWGFTPALFPALDRQLREFLADQRNLATAEFYLPAAVSTMIARGEASVRVLPTNSVWFGITYREDKPRVQAALAALVGEGKYSGEAFSRARGAAFMKFSRADTDAFAPDGAPLESALARVTHLCVAAHQDDIEIMAHAGIAACYENPRQGFGGVVVTDGAGSPRSGRYARSTDEEMRGVRRQEQRRAASLGKYAVQLQLAHPSADVKNPHHAGVRADLAAIFGGCTSDTVYLHNPADKHDTHIAVLLRCLEALRALPHEKRPRRVLGCEVWRDLDWLVDADKVALDAGQRAELSRQLLEVFDSQISGGKRYDLATLGRRAANATFHNSHATDAANAVTWAMDLTPLVADDRLNIEEFTLAHIERLRADVAARLRRFGS